MFDYVTDPTRFAEWQAGVVDGRMDGEPPHSVGELCLTTRRIGGAERSVTSQLTHIDPPRTGHGIGKVLVPLVVRRQAKREMPANLRRLKERLETSA